MTEVDTSFYPKPQPINPLTMYGNIQSIGGQMLSNQQAQQGIQSNQMELDAKNALMRNQAASMNPDGTQNTAQFNRLNASSPASLHAEDLMLQGNQLNAPTTYMGVDANGNPQQQIKGAQAITAQLTPQQQQAAAAAHDKVDALQGAAIDLANNPNPSPKGAVDTFGSLISDGHLTPQEAAAVIADPKDPMPQDPAKLKQWGARHAQQLGQKKAALNQYAPQQATSSPSLAASAPVGYTSPLTNSRDTYNGVKASAESAPQQNAAYNEVINLNNAGAPTGTNIANVYQYVAKNVPGAAQGITDKSAQAQEIGKWMSQGLIANGMPSSDARLQELQHGNLNPDQLPETIKELAPFFKAVNQGALAKQKFYNEQTGNGADLSKEPRASQQWNQNYDPRLIELDSLPDNKSKLDFLQKHPDLKSVQSEKKYNTLKQMGVVGGQ